MRLLMPVVAATMVISGCGSKTSSKQKAVPLLHDLSFRGARGRRVNAFLIEPAGVRRHLAGAMPPRVDSQRWRRCFLPSATCVA